MSFWETLLVAMVSGGLAGAVVRYLLDARKQRYENTIKLHETWWNSDFSKFRDEVFEIVKDIDSPAGRGQRSQEFLRCISEGNASTHPAWAGFKRIVVFFADLNVCIEKGLVDRDLAYRMFGEAQYYWFKPLIDAVRPHVGKKIGVRWAWETERLEEKFDAIKNRDQAKRSQLAAK